MCSLIRNVGIITGQAGSLVVNDTHLCRDNNGPPCIADNIPNTWPRSFQNKESRCVLPLKHVAQGDKAQSEGQSYEEVLGSRSVRVCQPLHVSPGHTRRKPVVLPPYIRQQVHPAADAQAEGEEVDTVKFQVS